MSNNTRIEWVDFLKGIAIMWLIVYHLHIFEWLRSPVPVFFFLSGLFFSEGSSFASFMRKKSKALLIPFAFFCVLGWVTSFLKVHFIDRTGWSMAGFWKLFTVIPVSTPVPNPLGVGAIWFLVSLFEVYLLYYVISKLSKNKVWLLIFALISFIASSLLMERIAMGSLWYLPYTLGFFIYFVIANVLRDYILNRKIPFWIFAVGVMMYLLTFVEVPMEVMGGISLNVKHLLSSLGLVFCLVYLTKSLLEFSKFEKIKAFVSYEGKNSLTILGIHMLAIPVVSAVLGHFLKEGTNFYILLFVFVLLICNICVWLFNRYVPFLVNHTKQKAA